MRIRENVPMRRLPVRLRRHGPHLVWLAIAGFAALGSFPGGGLHTPITVLAILLGALWWEGVQQRRTARALRWARVEIGEWRNRADKFELAATVDPVTGLANR